MKKIRVLTLGLVATALLVWALPATAQRSATVVKVTAGKPAEFRFTLSTKTAHAGSVTFVVTNKGQLAHDFKIAGKKTPLLQHGKTAKVTVSLKKGKYPYSCTVPGHAAAGMKGIFTVK